MAVSCMRNASGLNYRNSSFIVESAMGRYRVPQKVFLVNSYFRYQASSRVFDKYLTEYLSCKSSIRTALPTAVRFRFRFSDVVGYENE